MALGAAELLRPLAPLSFITAIAELPPSMFGLLSADGGCGFFDGLPTDAETTRFGGGGGAGILGTDVARTAAGGGVCSGGLLAPAACVDGERFVTNFVDSVGGSALQTTTGLILRFLTPFNALGSCIPAGGGGIPVGGGPGSLAISSLRFETCLFLVVVSSILF